MLRIFCSELTKDINTLEHKKYDELVDAAEILSLEKQTSQQYLFLAQILHAHPKLEQECILTAFSMNPTDECFQLVCELADRNNKATESTSQGNKPIQNESIDALHSITSTEVLLNSKDYNALKAPNRLLDSLTSLSEAVRSDLVCLLTKPRIKNLNWMVPWPELKAECKSLLVVEKKLQIVENTTAKANDNLKFINLNYEDFKDFTPHEYPGIETGYEIYVADSDSDGPLTNGNASGHEGDSTDTAPESKQFIVKEARRLKARKRNLIRRSQKMLEQSEIDRKIKVEPEDSDQAKTKRKRPRKSAIIDGLTSIKKYNRRDQLKKQKSADENSRSDKMENSNSGGGITIKTEPVDIKIEPVDVKTEPIDDYDMYEPQYESNADTKAFYDDDDGARTFADLSNIPQFNGANFSLVGHFDPMASSKECDFTELGKENSFTDQTSDIMHKPMDNFDEFTHLPFDTSNQCEQSHCESTPTMDNTGLVNSIILAEPKNEPDDRLFQTICDEQFNDVDDNAKIGNTFPNLVANVNDIFGLNHSELSYLIDETIMPSELATQPSSMNEPISLDQPPIINNSIAIQRNGTKPETEVPYESNHTNSENSTTLVPTVQSSKPKNPLLAFRKPKKCTIKPNDVLDSTNGSSNDSINATTTTTSSSSPLATNPLSTFNFQNHSTVTWTESMQSIADSCQSNNGLNINAFYGHPNNLLCGNVDSLPNDPVSVESHHI